MTLSGTDAGQVGDIMFAQVISGKITDESAVRRWWNAG